MADIPLRTEAKTGIPITPYRDLRRSYFAETDPKAKEELGGRLKKFAQDGEVVVGDLIEARIFSAVTSIPKGERSRSKISEALRMQRTDRDLKTDVGREFVLCSTLDDLKPHIDGYTPDHMLDYVQVRLDTAIAQIGETDSNAKTKVKLAPGEQPIDFKKIMQKSDDAPFSYEDVFPGAAEYLDFSLAAGAGYVAAKLAEASDNQPGNNPEPAAPSQDGGAPAAEKADKEAKTTWAQVEQKLLRYAAKEANGKAFTAKEQEDFAKAQEQREAMVELGNNSGIISSTLKDQVGVAYDFVLREFAESEAAGRTTPDFHPRERFLQALKTLRQRTGEPSGRMEGFVGSWFDGIERKVNEYVSDQTIKRERQLGMMITPKQEEDLRRVRTSVRLLNWGNNTDATLNRVQSMASAIVTWEEKYGPNAGAYKEARDRQSGAPARPDSSGLEAVFKPDPKKTERSLNSMLLSGKWESAGAAQYIDGQVNKLKEEGDPAVPLLRAMSTLVDEISQKVEFTSASPVLLTREHLVELHKQEGVMPGLRMMMNLLGCDVRVQAGGDVWRGKVALNTIFPAEIVNNPRYSQLFVDQQTGAARSFWDLKEVDMDRFGSAIKDVLSVVIHKPADGPEVEKAYAISVGLLKQSRAIEQFATDLEHPWLSSEFYRLMHPGDILIRRSLAGHPAAKEAKLAPYIKAHKDDFALLDPASGRYPDRAIDGTIVSRYRVPGTDYTWNELFFPPDNLKSWFFSKTVMADGKTFWDHLRTTNDAPTPESWKDQDMWIVEKFQRGAAVDLDKVLFGKTAEIKTENEAFALNMASDAVKIAKGIGLFSRKSSQADVDRVNPQIQRIMRVVAMSRIGMAEGRGRNSLSLLKGYVVSLGLEGLVVSDVGLQDNQARIERTINLWEPQFVKWVRENARPLEASQLSDGIRTVIRWISEDEHVQWVFRIRAQGRQDQNSVRLVNSVAARQVDITTEGRIPYGGIGTANQHWGELKRMSKKQPNLYKALLPVLRQYNVDNF